MSIRKPDSPPVDLLPAELLALIFETVHQNSRLRGRLGVSHTLSSVSRHWRNLATQTPSLWSFITIPISALALERSAGYLLDIHLHFSGQYKESNYASRAMRMLVPHTARWSTLFIVHGNQKMMCDAFGLLADIHAPNLRQCVLYIWGDSDERMAMFERPVPFLRGGTPRLVRLQADMDVPLLLDYPSCKSLSRLELQPDVGQAEWSSTGFYNMLAILPLEELKLRGVRLNSDYVANKVVAMERLVSLSIDISHTNAGTPPIHALRCPQLCNLWLTSFRDEDMDWLAGTITNNSSFPALQHVGIRGFSLPTNVFLRSVPTVTRLILYDAHLSGLFDELRDNKVLPLQRHVNIIFANGGAAASALPFMKPGAGAFVDLRREHRLPEVTVWLSSNVSFVNTKRIVDELEKEGINTAMLPFAESPLWEARCFESPQQQLP